MVSDGVGSIFRRTDEKYFIYLPKDLVENAGFPFPPETSVKVKIHFKPGEKKLIIETGESRQIYLQPSSAR